MEKVHYLDPAKENTKPVILIHGLGVDGSSWAMQFQPLIEAGYRPIAIDVPGFGDSPYGNQKWSIQRVADDLSELMERIKIIPAHVVGISMGGVIAQQLVLDHPEDVSKLVLVNTFSVLRPKDIQGWGYFLQRFALVHTLGIQVQAQFVSKRIFPLQQHEILRKEMIAQISKADPRAYRAAMRSLGLFNSKNRLQEIIVPTLVITGGEDTTVLPVHQTQMAGWLPGAQQVIIKGAGHAVSVEFPNEFNELLLEFLGNR